MEDTPVLSLKAAMHRSLKRTRDMYLSNYGQRPEIFESGYALPK